MSHFPGNRLEDFLCWNYHLIVRGSDFEEPIRQLYTGLKVVSREDFASLVKIWEPKRETIEATLDSYPGDDECSWRQWSDGAFDYVPKEIWKAGGDAVAGMAGTLTPGLSRANDTGRSILDDLHRETEEMRLEMEDEDYG